MMLVRAFTGWRHFRSGSLRLHLHAVPERHVALNVLGKRLGVWIIPRGVLVDTTLHIHVVIAGDAFPEANGVSLAFLKIIPIHRLRWEIMVAFHTNGLIAFRQHNPSPNCLRHDNLLKHYNISYAIC